jgi:hypothetical protein
MRIRNLIFALLISSLSFYAVADSGMWLPLTISQNLSQMRKAGLKLSADDIYSINKVCLKDAVVGLTTENNDFDPFCTASYISDKGLLVTNYHPMIKYIEMLSKKENDFLKFGYWAQKNEEESNCSGLQISQLIQMVDVTDELLAGTDTMSVSRKSNTINERGKDIVNRYTKGKKLESQIASYMAGNQYILSVYRIYKDIRLVAAPPMTIGKFGGDDDNWTWPRHTCDFSLIRVYVDKNNNPAKYNKENVPLTGNPFLKISLAGVKENDFVMVMGYPAHSKLYIPSFAIEYLENQELPAEIAIRGEKLSLIKSYIQQNPESKFSYTARVNSIANSYLRWKGELAGIKRMGLVNKKLAEEKELMNWIHADSSHFKKYGEIIDVQKKIYDDLKPYKLADTYFNEAGINGTEVIPFAGKFEKLVQMFNRTKINHKAIAGEVKRIKPLADQFFSNWDYELDKQIYCRLLYRFYENVNKKFIPEEMTQALKEYDGDVYKYADDAFSKSILTNKDKMNAFLENVDSTTICTFTSDPVYKMALSYYKVYIERISGPLKRMQEQQSKYYKLYMEALMEKNKGQLYCPDANQSLRVSYGKVTGSVPSDGMIYKYYTTLDGVFEKSQKNSGDDEYYIPKKMRELYTVKDFGKYAENGKIHTCFLTNCHTSSGNSGSPVLNAKGELVGINFDRMAEGVASDYCYLPELSRSITLDIRYMLFVLDKYSPSKNVLDELKIVK